MIKRYIFLLASLMLLALGGCAVKITTEEARTRYGSDPVIFGSVASFASDDMSIRDVCASAMSTIKNAPSDNWRPDSLSFVQSNCARANQFVVVRLNIYHRVPDLAFQYLFVPKSAGAKVGDILKVQMFTSQKSPPRFLARVADDEDPLCAWVGGGKHWAGNGGVECPRFSYSYRDLPAFR